MALCNLDDVKAFLGLEAPTSDDLLNTLINNASAFIENYTNRVFAVTNYVEIRNGTGNAKMPVQYAPITQLNSVKINDVDYTSYVKNTDNLIWFTNGNIFPSGLMNVELNYMAGYDAIPSDVSQVCVDLVAYKFKQKDRIGINSKTLGGEIVTFELRDIRVDIQNKLASYVRVV